MWYAKGRTFTAWGHSMFLFSLLDEGKKTWPKTKSKTAKFSSGVKENSPAALCLYRINLSASEHSHYPFCTFRKAPWPITILDNERWTTMWSYYINQTYFLLPRGRKQSQNTHESDRTGGSSSWVPSPEKVPCSTLQHPHQFLLSITPSQAVPTFSSKGKGAQGIRWARNAAANQQISICSSHKEAFEN